MHTYFFPFLHVFYFKLSFETVIACTSGAKWLLNSKCTNRIKHYRIIIKIFQAWRLIHVLTSSLHHPNPTYRCSLLCSLGSTMLPHQPHLRILGESCIVQAEPWIYPNLLSSLILDLEMRGTHCHGLWIWWFHEHIRYSRIGNATR